MYDLMIIGSGPAGISAALTAKARNLNFIWFGSRALSTKIEKAEKIMNYPGLPAFETYDELMAAIKEAL